jgi:alkylated DNA repair dioxygenase AlkB
MTDEKTHLTEHDLGGGLRFYSGRIPQGLIWDGATFEAAWLLHPEEKHMIMIHGRLVKTPRWQQAYGADYEYTGNVNVALPFPPLLQPLLNWVTGDIDRRLNGLLLNWYEGPDHYIGEHHDSTAGMIEGAPIVTVSFGETRNFRLSIGKGERRQVQDFAAPPGTVFVMPYDTNLVWKHGVPKSARYAGRRISVTFRAFTKGILAETA